MTRGSRRNHIRNKWLTISRSPNTLKAPRSSHTQLKARVRLTSVRRWIVSRRKLWIFACIAILLATLGTLRSTAYIISTRALYAHAAPCGKLHGFPRLLQAAGFVPSSGCIVDLSKGGCHDSRACTITNPVSGGSTKGNCTPSADKQSCVCVAK